VEFIDSISLDAPAAFSLLARIMHTAKLERGTVEQLALKIEVEGDPVVSPRDKLINEFDKLAV